MFSFLEKSRQSSFQYRVLYYTAMACYASSAMVWISTYSPSFVSRYNFCVSLLGSSSLLVFIASCQ